MFDFVFPPSLLSIFPKNISISLPLLSGYSNIWRPSKQRSSFASICWSSDISWWRQLCQNLAHQNSRYTLCLLILVLTKGHQFYLFFSTPFTKDMHWGGIGLVVNSAEDGIVKLYSNFSWDILCALCTHTFGKGMNLFLPSLG